MSRHVPLEVGLLLQYGLEEKGGRSQEGRMENKRKGLGRYVRLHELTLPVTR